MQEEITITAHYDKNTYRMHRYLIDEGQPIKGVIYIPKDNDGIPTRIVIELQEGR